MTLISLPLGGYSLAEASLYEAYAGSVLSIDPPHRAQRQENDGYRAKNERKQDTQAKGYLDFFCELIKIIDIFPHQQMVPVRQRLKRCAQRWSVSCIQPPF